MHLKSPLKYPGGKQKYASEILSYLKHKPKVFAEPFAGGASVALASEANKIVLNDIDVRIHRFWKKVLDGADADFEQMVIDLLEFKIDIDQAIMDGEEYSMRMYLVSWFYKWARLPPEELDATQVFCLNRWSNSAAMFRRPIGGNFQKGKYEIYCRFNAPKLVQQMREIRERYRNCLVFNSSYENVPYKELKVDSIYYDPPYYVWGQKGGIYDYGFDLADHKKLQKFVLEQDIPFIMSYDACDSYTTVQQEIIEDLMDGYRKNGCKILDLQVTKQMTVKSGPAKRSKLRERLIVRT